MEHIRFEKFNIPVATKDTKMMYVPEDVHGWIKDLSIEKGVRMTSILTGLIEHAKHSEVAFHDVLELVFEMEILLNAKGVPLNAKMKERLNNLDDLYIPKGV